MRSANRMVPVSMSRIRKTKGRSTVTSTGSCGGIAIGITTAVGNLLFCVIAVAEAISELLILLTISEQAFSLDAKGGVYEKSNSDSYNFHAFPPQGLFYLA